MAHRDGVQLRLGDGGALVVTLLSSGRVNVKLEGQPAGSFRINRDRMRAIVYLSRSVLFRDYEPVHAQHPDYAEVVELRIRRKRRITTFLFKDDPDLETMPDDMLLLVREMYGLTPI